jgi:uncharacterized protein YndB with AHSA1/START domain
MIRMGLIAAALSALAGSASAAVVDTSPQGFEVVETVEIAAPAAKVWSALIQPGQWWSSVHTFSHDAHNLTLDPGPGGCWCEALPGGGGVRHLAVIYVAPGQTLRLEGALGPFQAGGTAGHLTWTLAEAGGHTTVTETYDLGGYFKGGLEKDAPVVDGVLGEQAARLKMYVETGRPAP